MKDEIIIPDHSSYYKEEEIKREKDLKAAAKRSEEYSRVRDEQANDNNEAIKRRLANDRKNIGEDKK